MSPRLLASRLAACALGSIALIGAPAAFAAWPTTPAVNAPVSADPARFTAGILTVPDSCGGMIVGWVDQGTVMTVDVQRMDAFGQPRWATNGFPVTPPMTSGGAFDIASDDAGGAYVVWIDQRTAVNGIDLYVQHVLAAGMLDPAWPPTGVPVCEAPGEQAWPRIVPDGAGGALIAWEDSRGNVDFAPDIYAQRVSAAGAVMWALDGVPVVVQPNLQASLDLAPDGGGGLFVGWDDLRTGEWDIFAQHLEPFAGARTWAPSGLPVCTAAGGQFELDVASENGRLFLAWVDDRNPGNQAIYAQGLDIGGSALWVAGGIPVSAPADPNNGTPQVVPDAIGGAIIGWQAFDAGGSVDDIHAQHVNAAGSLVWSPGGVVVCGAPGRQLFMRGISDQRGGAIFAWDDRRVSESAIDIFAQRLDGSAGVALWTADGVAVSTATGNQVAPMPVTDGAGGAVMAWQDQRPSPDIDVYGQQVGSSGVLGLRAASRNCEPDFCGFGYIDFGDAPEAIPAFPSGAPGHYPTCTTDSQPGTQEVLCGTPLSTTPGLTGYVQHFAGWNDAVHFGLGCDGDKVAVTSETDGVEKFGPLPASIPSEVSACGPGVLIRGYEPASFGMYWGADEVAGGADAALGAPPVMSVCQQRRLSYTAFACASQPITVYLNVLVDWSMDGDWNDVLLCGALEQGDCAPEWAVKNVAVQLAPGCNQLDTPVFWTGPYTGPTWMRLTLTAAPVSDDFPWRGSAPTGSGDAGYFAGGETEDYPVTITDPTGVGEPAATVAFRLEAPVPNPTADATTVRFALPHPTRAELGVFDVLGRRVRALVSAPLGAGEHVATWDGRDASGARASAGLYFVRLRADGAALSRAIVLTR